MLLLIELRREQSQLEVSVDTATQRLSHARIELDRLQYVFGLVGSASNFLICLSILSQSLTISFEQFYQN